MGHIVLGAAMTVLALLGLFLASRTHEGALHYAGLALFALGVAVDFWLIARNTGHPHEPQSR